MGLAAVSALPLGLRVKLGLARGKYVSASSLSAFRAATVRSVWSGKMPLADTPVILNMLDRKVWIQLFTPFGPDSA